MHILVTGGTGFIGSHIVTALLEQGHHVRVSARSPRKNPGLVKLNNVEILYSDLSDYAHISQCVQGMDAVIHVAYCPGKGSGLSELETDTRTTIYLYEAAARAGVKHFIYTSSTSVNDSVYGGPITLDGEFIDTVKRGTKQNPVTLYGATKAASENYIKALSHTWPVRTNIIRPGYTFGNPVIPGAPTQSDTRFKDIVALAKAGNDISVNKNDGTQFIWAGHLAEIYLAVLNSDVNRETYFGLSKYFISWETVARLALEMSGSSGKLIVENEYNAVEPVVFDVTDIQREFGLSFDPMNKIREHIEYYLAL